VESRRFVAGDRFFELTWEDLLVEVVEGRDGRELEPVQSVFFTHDELREFIDRQVQRWCASGFIEGGDSQEPQKEAASAAELEALIERDPTAAEPFLVYADWLQAHGDPRGELIALQERLGRDPTAELKAEEAALMARYADHFLGGLSDQPSLATLRFRLGFAERACLFVDRSQDADEEVLLKGFLHHPTCRFLRELVVCHTEGWGLRSLVEALARSSVPPTVVKLCLGDARHRPGLAVPDGLLNLFPRLEELALFADPIELSPFTHPRLAKVVLHTTLRASHLSALAGSRLPALEALELAHEPHNDEPADLAALSHPSFAQLKRLAFRQLVTVRGGRGAEARQHHADQRVVDDARTLLDLALVRSLESLELGMPHQDALLQLLLERVRDLQHLRPLTIGDCDAQTPTWTEAHLDKLRRAGLHVERAAPWPREADLLELKDREEPESESDEDAEDDEDDGLGSYDEDGNYYEPMEDERSEDALDRPNEKLPPIYDDSGSKDE
jgi:uncharacterized protein (TIGR02996 family)